MTEELHPHLAGLQVEQAPDESTDDGQDAQAINGGQSYQDPAAIQESSRNAREGKGPNAAGDTTSSTAEDEVPSISDPSASNLPSANAPEPSVANPQVNPNAAAEKPSVETR